MKESKLNEILMEKYNELLTFSKYTDPAKSYYKSIQLIESIKSIIANNKFEKKQLVFINELIETQHKKFEDYKIKNNFFTNEMALLVLNNEQNQTIWLIRTLLNLLISKKEQIKKKKTSKKKVYLLCLYTIVKLHVKKLSDNNGLIYNLNDEKVVDEFLDLFNQVDYIFDATEVKYLKKYFDYYYDFTEKPIKEFIEKNKKQYGGFKENGII